MRPLVGVTTWRRRLETFYGPDTLQTLSTHYVDALTGAGITPILLPAATDPSEAERLVATVDGLVLTGGDDVDPAAYGEVATHSRGHDPEVDAFEIALVDEARRQGKPVLAICRGLQLLNVALGGTLHQEVTSPAGVHDLITRDHEEMAARRHVVRFADGSLLAAAYGGSEAKVNSLHHQGVDRLAPGLVVEGTSDDGLVEAVSGEGDWWVVGVQWHPERLDGDHRGLFDAFRQALTAS